MFKSYNFTLLLFFLALVSFSVGAQPLKQTIRGTIIDQVTEAPLVGATVQLVGSNPLVVVSADANGRFEMRGVS